MFEFEFVFQPFDIRFQAALNRRWPFGLQSIALCSHSELLRLLAVRRDFFVLMSCRQHQRRRVLLPLPSLPVYRRAVQLLTARQRIGLDCAVFYVPANTV